jgi:S1-C subfamily serine protease
MKLLKYLNLPVLAILLLALLISSSLSSSKETEDSILSKLSLSLVKVLDPARPGSGGTGFVTTYNNRMVVMTNDHVCALNRGGRVMIVRDGEFEVFGDVIKRDFAHDLCITTFGVKGYPAVQIGDKDLKSFDRLFIVGHPRLRPRTPNVGRLVDYSVEHIAYQPSKDDECQSPAIKQVFIDIFSGEFTICRLDINLGLTNVFIAPGNSGSPVVNDSGKLIGVINSGSEDMVGGYVPLKDVKEFLSTP